MSSKMSSALSSFPVLTITTAPATFLAAGCRRLYNLQQQRQQQSIRIVNRPRPWNITNARTFLTKSSPPGRPTLVFGDVRDLDLAEIEPLLHRHGVSRLDSAAVYAGGESERRLGEARWGERFRIDTKIWSGRPSDGTLAPASIAESVRASLERLRVQRVNVLYCHGPDYATPMEEQARAFDALHRQGKFAELGLANCMTEYVQRFLATARVHGYVRPTWFQGQYNLVVRSYERSLFPLLRAKGVHFAAYSPLAGGFLNGNLTPEGASGKRFTGGHGASNTYRKNFDKPAMHAAYKKLKEVADAMGVPTNELSLRWLVYHSQLEAGDAVILGASRPAHIEQSHEQVERGPLEGEVARKLDALWNTDLQAAADPIVDFGPARVR